MAKKKKKEIKKKTDRTLLFVIAAALLIGIFVFWAASKDANRGEVPAYLVGKWLADAPAYQERYLEINDVSLIFATGATTVAEYFITSASSAASGKMISFTFECKDLEDNLYQFSLIYQPDNGGTLYFKNQPHVKWMKSRS